MREEEFYLYLGVFLLGLAPLTLPSFLIFHYWLHNKYWNRYDILLVTLPILIYSLFKSIFHLSKSLSNLIEPQYLGVSCGIIFIIRCLFARFNPEHSMLISQCAVIIASILAIGIYLLTPGLPE